MKGSFLELVKNKTDHILKDKNILAVILIGSGANTQETHPLLRDIDIFVIRKDGDILEREVVERDHIEWDITYLPLKLLKQGIKEKWPFLIQSLRKHQPLSTLSEEINILLTMASEIYNEGPGVLNQEEILYYRFKLTQAYEDLIRLSAGTLESNFLSQNIFKEILVTYFKLNNQWIPGDKKILATLKERELGLFNLAKEFLADKNKNKTLANLEDMIKYVLNPFGGKLKYWTKGKFPLK